MSVGYVITTLSSEPLQLFTIGVKGCSIAYIWFITHLRVCHLLDYSIKRILDLMIGSSECLFSLENNLGIALENLFQQKDQMWYQYCVAIYFYPIWHKCQSVLFLSQGSVDSAVGLGLVVVFFSIAVFSIKRIYLLTWHCIPQSPGLLNCHGIRTDFFFYLAEVCLCLYSYQTWTIINVSGTFWTAKRSFMYHIWIGSRNLLILKF